MFLYALYPKSAPIAAASLIFIHKVRIRVEVASPMAKIKPKVNIRLTSLALKLLKTKEKISYFKNLSELLIISKKGIIEKTDIISAIPLNNIRKIKRDN